MASRKRQVENKEYSNIRKIKGIQIANITRPGTKFHYAYDRDIWHIVNIVNDSNDLLIVIKSWNKYKQRWVYKVENIFTFIWTLGIMEELYKDEHNNYYIKDKKYGK